MIDQFARRGFLLKAIIIVALICAAVSGLSLVPGHAGSLETLKKAKGTPTFAGRACTLVVEFGSEGSGVDSAMVKRLTEKLKSTKTVKRTTIEPWGKEGEQSFCVEAARNRVSATNYVSNILRSYGAPKKGTVRLKRGFSK